MSLRTREAYYNYARTRAARSVAVAALAQAEAHRRDTDALVNAGSIARVELVRADAQVASAKVSLARAEFSVQTARSALATLAHAQKEVEDITVSENLETDIPGPVEDEKGLYAKALERRSELKALTMLMQAQEHTVGAYKGLQLPVVAIGGTAEEANPNQRIFGSYNEWKGTWAAQVALVWSPNDTFSSGDNVDSARADLAQTVADLNSLRDALRIEISQAFNGWAVGARVAGSGTRRHRLRRGELPRATRTVSRRCRDRSRRDRRRKSAALGAPRFGELADRHAHRQSTHRSRGRGGRLLSETASALAVR